MNHTRKKKRQNNPCPAPGPAPSSVGDSVAQARSLARIPKPMRRYQRVFFSFYMEGVEYGKK